MYFYPRIIKNFLLNNNSLHYLKMDDFKMIRNIKKILGVILMLNNIKIIIGHLMFRMQKQKVNLLTNYIFIII